jgi:hypothetical protein
MTIKEWLTPELFDINVILVALLINWTLFSFASNFLEDFKIPVRIQNLNYMAVLVMCLAYGILILLGLSGVIQNRPTLYPNRYDFLLMGNERAFGCILGGIFIGGPLGWFLGNRDKLRWTMAVLAILLEGLIGIGTLLWILAQE